MNLESSRALVEELAVAVNQWDEPALHRLLSTEVVWHVPGSAGDALAGTHEGRDAVMAVLARARAMTGGTLSDEVVAIIADELFTVAIVSESAERDGRRLDGHPLVHVFRLVAGKVLEMRTYTGDPVALDAFWSAD